MDNRFAIKIFFSFLVGMLFSLNFVFALGVSYPYWSENPLKLEPGQSWEVPITLVNRDGDSVETAFVSITDDADIAELEGDNEHDVVLGGSTTFDLKVEIPTDAPVGTDYLIKLSIGSTPETEGGIVQIGVGYGVEIPVSIVQEGEASGPLQDTSVPEKVNVDIDGGNTFSLILIVIIVLLIVLVVIWIIRSRKG